MKSPVLPFGPALLDTMGKAREALADTVLDPVAVKSLLTKAAGEGRAVCVIPVPVDLRETAAGERIVAWCGEQGLRVDWSRRSTPDAHSEAAFDLVVSWGTPAA